MDIKKEAKNKNKSWMDRNFGKLIAVLLVILMMSVVLFIVFDPPQKDQTDNISDKINDKHWVVYTMSNCPACIEQNKILGNHFDKIIIITCDESQYYYNMCKSENIQAVPTWVNLHTGQHVEGYQTLEAIEVMLNDC